jgi:hypothetical protein
VATALEATENFLMELLGAGRKIAELSGRAELTAMDCAFALTTRGEWRENAAALPGMLD